MATCKLETNDDKNHTILIRFYSTSKKATGVVIRVHKKNFIDTHKEQSKIDKTFTYTIVICASEKAHVLVSS